MADPACPASPEPAGLYVHVPFCSAICPYCDFAVKVGGRDQQRSYVDTLLAEIRLWGEQDHDRDPWRFDTLYLGGGTPSLLSPEDLDAILSSLGTSFEIARGAPISLEANPEDIRPENLAAWRDLGVSTLSLGVQSFLAEDLEQLGRRHDARQARDAVVMSLQAGFATVSIDLIFGLHTQAMEPWRQSLETAISLRPQHISCYQLEIHPRTPFGKRHARGELPALAEPEQEERFLLTHELLGAGGYQAYEVSNFALGPQHRSRHNSKYWRHTPYLGLGPSSHSFRGNSRWWNERHFDAWRKRIDAGLSPIAGSEELSPEDLALETLMLTLRTVEGLDLKAFRKRFGYALEALNRRRLASWRLRGLLRDQPGHLCLTTEGMALADGLAASLELA